MSGTRSVRPDGTINWPVPPGAAVPLVVSSQLHGHTSSDRWLPSGLWPELDGLRERHLKLRAQAIAEADRVRAVAEQHKREDSEHSKALAAAFREGGSQPDDTRTPAVERAAQLAGAQERMWTAARILGEHAAEVIATIRERETEWLADLRGRVARAEEEYRQALAAAEEKRAQMMWVPLLGKWLQANADDQGFGRQPVPSTEQAQAQTVLHPNVARDALQRPWHRVRPWLPDPDDEAARERGADQRREMERQEAEADALALEPGESALVQPLDEAVRYAKRSAA